MLNLQIIWQYAKPVKMNWAEYVYLYSLVAGHQGYKAKGRG